MARAREKHSSFAMVLNAVGISLFGTYPCMLIFLAFLYLMEIVIRNPTYEYYCDSVAVKFAGGNIFASALEKWTDLLLADESVKSRDTGALRPISETMTNGDEHAEFSTAELTRSAQLEGHWPEAYVERLNSEYCRLRYFDPPLRRAAVQKKTRNHPSVSDRIAKTAQAERRVDSSEPLFSDLDVELWWPKAES